MTVRTMWEDGECAGFNCPHCNKDCTVSVGEITECVCGKKYKLKWLVEVSEVVI